MKDDSPRKPWVIVRWWQGPQAERRRRLAGRCAIAFAWGCALTGCLVGLIVLEHRISSSPKRKPVAVRARLRDTPVWMPDALAAGIAKSILPDGGDLNDPNLAARACARAQANPWVRRLLRVEKRMTKDPRRGVLEVYAEYRKPMANVLLKDNRTCVPIADDGYRLPDDAPQWVAQVLARDGRSLRRAYFVRDVDVPLEVGAERVHYIILDGVEADPPPVGRRWPGEDVEAGLKLVKLFWDKPYVNQIARVDVRNFGCRASREEPQLRIVARRRGAPETVVLFGSFPDPEGDWVVPPDRKIHNLNLYVRNHNGALAGLAKRIDVRGDRLTFVPY